MRAQLPQPKVPRSDEVPLPAFLPVREPVAEPRPPVPLPKPMAWRNILIDVAREHKLTVADIIGESRKRPMIAARHEAIYRLRTETTMSWKSIAHRLGGRDHTTILNGYRRHLQRMSASQEQEHSTNKESRGRKVARRNSCAKMAAATEQRFGHPALPPRKEGPSNRPVLPDVNTSVRSAL